MVRYSYQELIRLRDHIRLTPAGAIEVNVVDIRGDKVRQGIHAPHDRRELPIDRWEVAQARHRERLAKTANTATSSRGDGADGAAPTVDAAAGTDR